MIYCMLGLSDFILTAQKYADEKQTSCEVSWGVVDTRGTMANTEAVDGCFYWTAGGVSLLGMGKCVFVAS